MTNDPLHEPQTDDKPVRVTIINYSSSEFTQREVASAPECSASIDTKTVTWINVDGINNQAVIEEFGREFNIHPLLLEDIMDTKQRPKIEDFDDHLFIVIKMLTWNEKRGIDTEQVSIVLGKNYVITFQEKEGDVFNQLRDRIKTGKGRVRKMGVDFLAYALIDAIVDYYFVILETFGEEFELIEEELLSNPTEFISAKLHTIKRELILLRKSVWPLREIIKEFERNEIRLIRKGTLIFMRDIYDHTVQVIDSIETYRDILSGMFDIYLSSISYRMNAVMKVLTIIATIFIPLTFIVGLYGMNFKLMPELGWKWGYPAVWGVILGVAVTMIIIFKRKKWL